MERRSKRLRTTSKPNYGVDLDSDADIPDPDVASEKATKTKRTKAKEPKSKRAVRGRRGSLERITCLPLDILFEIFSLLDPIDILNLSRTSKSLRTILMRRSSRYVWKNARARFDGLPECPGDMSEPEYANLVFYPYCHVCLKAYVGSRAIFWEMRTRICKHCIPLSLVSLPFDDDITENMIPTCSLSTNNRIHGIFVNADTLRQYQNEKKDLRGSALDEWYALKHSDHEARVEHAFRCDMWNEDRNSERLNELDNLREQRFQAIKERLSNLGWSEEIAQLEDAVWRFEEEVELAEHRLVKQPKVLTERIWNNIKDTLVEFLEGAKARRLERSYCQMIRRRRDVLEEVLRTYASSQPLHAIFPPVSHLEVLPAFKAVIEGIPPEEEVVELHFQQAMVDFPQVIEEWRHSRDEALLAMINNHPETQTKTTSILLEQAGIYFSCPRCLRRLSYPCVLVHWCFVKQASDDFVEYHESSTIKYDHLASRLAGLILHDCQLDAETMTTNYINELTDMGLRFECLLCKSRKEGRLVMKWLTVINHVMCHHRMNVATNCTGIIQLADLTPAEELLVSMLEYVMMSPTSRAAYHDKCWICNECKRTIPWSDSLEHYKQKHPDVLPADYTDHEHKCHPDRYLTLCLDAYLVGLCAPVKVNIRAPIHGFRDALSLYRRYSNEELDMIAEQMAAIFLTKN